MAPLPFDDLTDRGSRPDSATLRAATIAALATHRVLRVARTIADLAGCESISEAHLAGAIRYRALDRDRRP